MKWPMVKLESICQIRSGGTPSRSNPAFYGGNIAWAKISDIDQADDCLIETEEKLTSLGLAAIRGRVFEPGTLFFAIYGSIGKMAFAGKRMATNQAILGLTFKDLNFCSPRFYFHWLRFSNSTLLAEGNGIAQKNLSAGYLRELSVPLPPLDEQKRIAAILDKADALRRKRRQALALLDGLAQAIFVDMFGDPKYQTEKWLSLPFDSALTDVTSKSEKIQRQKYLSRGDIPVVDQGKALIGGWTNEEMACISNLPVVIFGDHTRSVKYIDFKFAIGADGAKVLSTTNKYDTRFMAYLLKLMPIPDLGYSRHMRHLKRMEFWCPPLEAQMRFSKAINTLETNKKYFQNNAETLDALFASLQHRAFHGEL